MSSHSQDQMQKLNSPFGELQMRVDTDQWGRRPGADRTQAGIEAQAGFDRDNQQYVQSQLDRHGWPKDPQAAHYAWLIAQHADNDPAWQQKFLDTARAAKWDNKADLAYLDDRIRTNAGRPQMYGTQFKTVYDDKARSWALESFPIEDETNLDNRRKENNLEPMQQYRNFANERMKELNLPAPTKMTMQPNPQEQRLINRYSVSQSNKEGVQQCTAAMPARASAPSPTDTVQLNRPDLNSAEMQWQERQPAQLASMPKRASTVYELPFCATKQANTLGRTLGNLAKDLTYYKPGAGVLRNTRNLAWSSFSPGWGNVANRAATGLGAKPNTARNIGRAVTAGTFIPTSAYALSGLKGMYDDYKRTDDKARAAAGAMLASAETGAGAAENYTGVQASLLPNRQKGQSGLVSDPMRDTLQATRDHGMLAGLYRHYVAGVPSLADPSEGPAAYQRVSNRSLLTPELRQSVDAGLNSFASTALHNAGKTLHDVPTWHKVMTTFTSPIQRIVRPMLPSDEVRNPGSLAVQSATGLPQLPTDILSAMERTTSSDQNRLLRGLGESYKLMRKYAPRPAQKQPEPQVYPQYAQQ